MINDLKKPKTYLWFLIKFAEKIYILFLKLIKFLPKTVVVLSLKSTSMSIQILCTKSVAMVFFNIIY